MSEITLLNNQDWTVIDGEFCKVIEFVQIGVFNNGKVTGIDKTTPYATIKLECKQIPSKIITGLITHKLDFIHLYQAFKERGVAPNEEVIISWSVNHYKSWLYKAFSFMMPKLWVMICKNGAFELMTDPSSRPDLGGEARWLAEKPIIQWKPEVME